MKTLLTIAALLCLGLTACGSDTTAPTTGSDAASTPAADWNEPVEPPVVVDGLASSISVKLPVVTQPGQARGTGLLDASIGASNVDDSFVYVEVGRAAGCATFEHLALTPTDEVGVYQLFYDTDNTCEAFGITGYRTPIVSFDTADDGTITLLDTTGSATEIAVD